MKIQILKNIDATFGRLLDFFWVLSRFPQELPTEPRQVLLIRPGGIGDAVLLIPMIKALAEQFPDCQIHVLAEKRNARVFDFCPCISALFCYDRLSDWLAVWNNTYDVVIDTEQWHRLSALFGRLIGGRFLVGFGTNDRVRLLSRAVDYDLDRYEVFSFLSLLAPWGIELPVGLEDHFLELPERGRGKIHALLANCPAEEYIALCPGGSRPEKSWEEDRFVELARRLSAEGFCCVVLGGTGDVAVASRVADAGQGLCLAGKTSLFESAVALQMSKAVVANDTGLLHLAAGLGRPTVGIFGPSNPKKWGPRGESHRMLWQNLDCAPCSTYGVMPDCSFGFRCLLEIDVDAVLESVLDLVGVGPEGSDDREGDVL